MGEITAGVLDLLPESIANAANAAMAALTLADERLDY